MSPLLAFVLVLIGLTVITCIAMFFRYRPSRACPRCGSIVDITRWRCKYCGYQFQRIDLFSK